MSFARTRRLGGVLTVALAAGVGIAGTSSPSMAGPKGPLMDIQILSFNDFHGNLEPPSGSSGRITTGYTLPLGATAPVATTVDAGGVEYLATQLRNARKGNRNSVTVAAGDLVGASPLLSAAFHDEPTIEALNELGLEASAVGNHEFDEGYKELQRLQNGGCLPDGAGLNNQDSCAAGTFKGARFTYLTTNVMYTGTHKTILPPYWVKNMNGAKIGFIGLTLKETPSIVTAAGVAGLDFTDEIAAAKAVVPVLRKQGVKAIIALVHQGGTPAPQSWTGPGDKTYTVGSTYKYTCSEGGTLTDDSAILRIAEDLDPQIDMIVSGHTHNAYVCNVPDPKGQQRLVTSASSFGRLFTETNMSYDLRTNDIVRSSVQASNMVVSRDVHKATHETKIVDTYKKLIAPIANKVLGTISATLTRSYSGESTLGDLIADAQVNDPSVVTGGQTPVVAFMNPGGIRADLGYGKTDPPEAVDGIVRYEEAFTVQPFNNYMVSMNLTGADIWSLLGQQWSGSNAGSGTKFLQVSNGLHYTVTTAGTTRTVTALTIQDPNSKVYLPVANDDSTPYRIVTNNFLSDGGDNFAAFKNGTGKYFGGLDIDAFANYLPKTKQPYAPLELNRIIQLP